MATRIDEFPFLSLVEGALAARTVQAAAGRLLCIAVAQ